MRASLPAGLLSLLLLVVAGPVSGHGSVTAGADLCIIRIGFYTAHFKIYQPGRSGYREFCEDLPAGGDTLFVMEYLHDSLGQVPLEFRIISNTTGLGRFTRPEDLPGAADMEGLTVFHHAQQAVPDVFTVRHVFGAEGDYIGVVTARHPASNEEYLAVFPFQVGSTGLGLMPLWLILLLLAQLGYWWSRGSLRRWSGNGVLLMLLAQAVLEPAQARAAMPDDAQGLLSEGGRYRVQMQSDQDPLPLNVMHAWTVLLHSEEGEPVAGAQLTLVGGMPAHNHGLPSAPQVQATAEPGRYRVEGVRFHMQGEWVLELHIRHAGREDRAYLPVHL